MAFLFVLMFGLNMVQANKDIAKCKKSDFKEKGCSVYVKIGADKKK